MIMISMTPIFPDSDTPTHLTWGGDTGSGGALMTCATLISNVQSLEPGRTQSGQFGERASHDDQRRVLGPTH